MASYAIVIGCQAYSDPAVPQLNTPVEDALRMAAWLAQRQGGLAPRG